MWARKASACSPSAEFVKAGLPIDYYSDDQTKPISELFEGGDHAFGQFTPKEVNPKTGKVEGKAITVTAKLTAELTRTVWDKHILERDEI